jgi:hypothetical protein
MFFLERKTIIMTTIIVGGLIYLAGIFTIPQTNTESNVDKLENYLYSTPVIIKRLKAFFSFSDLPIFEVSRKNVALNIVKNTAGIPNLKPIPSPTASPIAAKPTTKPGNKTNTAGGSDGANFHPKFVVENFNNKQVEPEFSSDNPEAPSVTVTSGAPNTANSTEKNVNDWKYRLYMNPSKENMNVFIQEYLSGKVTKDVFYGVLKSLINESDDRSQSIAIYGLSAVPSYDSYEILALKIDDKSLRKDNQNVAQKNLDYYSSPENQRILLIALKSSHEVVTLQALRSVMDLAEHHQLGRPQQDVSTLSEREKRGLSSAELKNDSYLEFTNALQGLTKNSNSQIAILAENTLQQFQELTPAHPNYEASNTQPGSRTR